MSEKARFTRRKEDFICEVCGARVRGNGYTNHCPNCLASKHVDINPGDRASSCHGVMEPVGYEIRHGKEFIVHKCRACGYVRPNKVVREDNREVVRMVASGKWHSSQFSAKKNNA